ncbi:hypothetical protein LMG28727_03719 [Paraburkholderia kirstenboschensis]|nr:hypothetical protein LMG28727_03719 [Paraburkholderia kirstenboschensis]
MCAPFEHKPLTPHVPFPSLWSPPMAQDIFIKINGIDGESQDAVK